jgi:very-short-patch-repair endonuclease
MRAELRTRTFRAARRHDARARRARVTEADCDLRSARIRPRRSEVFMFARRLVSAHQAQVLAERARFMRFSPTRAEEWLWRELSGSKIGFPFRRQLVIGNHIVDFACTKVRLVVELDGTSHLGRERLDAHRDRTLTSLGWHVLRIADDDVFAGLDAVVSRIQHAARVRLAR